MKIDTLYLLISMTITFFIIYVTAKDSTIIIKKNKQDKNKIII